MDEDASLKKRNLYLYMCIALATLVGALSVSTSIIWLDRHNKIEDARRQQLDQARDVWARYDSGIAACERGNTLRIQVNDLVAANKAVNGLLVEFFDTSVKLRRQLGQPELAKKALDAREQIRRVAKRTKQADLVNCATVIPIPSVLRPPPMEGT